jgi:hypothetical protein
VVFAEHFDGGALDWEKLPSAPPRIAPATGVSTFGEDVGVSRDVLMFVMDGAPIGQQRGYACRAARALLANGKSVEETTDQVWRGLQASPIGDQANPWTHEDVRAIVEDLSKRKPTALKASPELRITPRPPSNGGGATLGFHGANGIAPRSDTAPIDGASASDAPSVMVSSGTSISIPEERKQLFRSARQIAEATTEEPTWRMPGYVADGVVTELDGKLKASGKTTLLMAMVGSVVEGRPFLGKPTVQTGVIILTEQNTTSFRAALARAGLLERDDVLVLF